ncbi:MAG: MmgE/PrpD family protein [Paracoccaceae bacterium]
MDHLGLLAEATAAIDPPEHVRAKSALILADTIGAIVGGAAEAEVRALTERMIRNGQGDAVVIGPGRRTSPHVAALLNGTAGTTLEMDEGHRFAKGHPGMHVIPALLAAASNIPCSGREFLAAITVGYEAAARVGMATALRPSMHPHGTWGAIGAAAGVLRLMKKPAALHRDAMNMAASLGSTPSRRTMLEGGTVRNVFAGVSNQTGLVVADLVEAGFSGDHNGVAEVFGKTVSDSFKDAELSRDLGERWEVTRNYFKMHSCCRFNHATLDALNLLLAETGDLQPTDIASVSVETYDLAAELEDKAPRNVLAAKFSVPFAVATRLVTGSSGVESFSAERVADPAIQALAQRVTVREDPGMSAQLPEGRPARIRVTLSDGREVSASTDTNLGDWDAPYSEGDIHEKFLSLTARFWSPGHAKDVWSACFDLDRAPDMASVLNRLAEGEGKS